MFFPIHRYFSLCLFMRFFLSSSPNIFQPPTICLAPPSSILSHLFSSSDTATTIILSFFPERQKKDLCVLDNIYYNLLHLPPHTVTCLALFARVFALLSVYFTTSYFFVAQYLDICQHLLQILLIHFILIWLQRNPYTQSDKY